MTDHTHCWHAVTITSEGETPYAQRCCWCGTRLYQDGVAREVAAHGPYTALHSAVHVDLDAEINATLTQSWGRFLKDTLR